MTEEIEPLKHLRLFSLDDMIDYCEQCHDPIKSPFSPDERSLAQAVAAAQYFAQSLMELPGRAPTWDSLEGWAFWWGIWKVCIKRGDCPDPGVRRAHESNRSVGVEPSAGGSGSRRSGVDIVVPPLRRTIPLGRLPGLLG